jgi:surface protein
MHQFHRQLASGMRAAVGGGPSWPADAFVIEVQMPAEDLEFVYACAYNPSPTATIDWGDGNSEAMSSSGNSHTYASAGAYNISIHSGSTNPIQTQDPSMATCRAYITRIKQWGTVNVSDSWNYTFFACGNLTGSDAADAPDLSGNCGVMFTGCSVLDDLNAQNWDVSGVTNMNSLFKSCSVYDEDLTGWCVTNFLSEPTDFNTNGIMTNKPVWGTCP